MSSDKYVSKRREVEAKQVSWDTAEEIASWCGGKVVTEIGFNDESLPGINVPTLKDIVRASEGDYVVRSASGTFQKMSRFAFESEFQRPEDRDFVDPPKDEEVRTAMADSARAVIDDLRKDPRERWRTL